MKRSVTLSLIAGLAIGAIIGALFIKVLSRGPQAASNVTTPGNFCSPSPTPTFNPEPTSSSGPVSNANFSNKNTVSVNSLLGIETAEAACTPLPIVSPPNPNGPRCNNGKDDDNDTTVDYPADPGCVSKTDQSEDPNPECSDGKDNDTDQRIDQSDPDCFKQQKNGNDTVYIYDPRDNREQGNSQITPSPSGTGSGTPTPTPSSTNTPATSPSPTAARPVQVLVEGTICCVVTGLPFNSTVKGDVNARAVLTAAVVGNAPGQSGKKRIKITVIGKISGKFRFGIINVFNINAPINETQYQEIPIDISDAEAMARIIPFMMGQAQALIPEGVDVQVVNKSASIFPPYVAKLKFGAEIRATVAEVKRLKKQEQSWQDIQALLRNKRLEITTHKD